MFCHAPKPLNSDVELPGAQPGDAFTLKGYTSTSVEGYVGSGPDHLEISVKPGQPGYYIVASYGTENEVLLPRDTRLVVDSVEGEGGRRTIRAHVEPAVRVRSS